MGAKHSLAYNKSGQIYVLYICTPVEHMYQTAREVNVGKSTQNLPHADNTKMTTTNSTDRISMVTKRIKNIQFFILHK